MDDSSYTMTKAVDKVFFVIAKCSSSYSMCIFIISSWLDILHAILLCLENYSIKFFLFFTWYSNINRPGHIRHIFLIDYSKIYHDKSMKHRIICSPVWMCSIGSCSDDRMKTGCASSYFDLIQKPCFELFFSYFCIFCKIFL